MNKNLTIDNLDTPNPRVDHDGPWSLAARPAPRDDWRNIIARWACGTLAAGIAWWVAPEWAQHYVVVAGLGLGTLAGAKHLLTDTIGGVAVRTWRNDVRGTDIVGPLGLAAVEHARRNLPNVSSYSPTVQQLPAGRDQVPASRDTVEGQVVDVLPEIVLVESWLPWLTDEMSPHLLLIGKTRSGKSTLADIILAFRARRGDQIAILDPHWSTQDKYGNKKWGGIPPMARTVAELKVALRQLKAEYDERKRRMALPAADSQFTPEGCFPPLTILIDEVPEVVTELAALPKSDRDHGIWGETVKIFGSGGAKVNISVILLSQSPNVEDVGINGKMRENFTTIALANMARPFIDRYEADKARKPRLFALMASATREGMKPAELPAAAEYSGECKVLSRDGILSHRVTTIEAEVWSAPRQLAESPADPPPVEYTRASVAHSQPRATLRASVTPPPAPIFRQERMEIYLKALVLQRKTRKQIRAWCDAQGLQFDNNLLARVRSDLGLSAERGP